MIKSIFVRVVGNANISHTLLLMGDTWAISLRQVIQYLEMGKVLDCPLGGHCPEEVYRLMLGCWRKHPENRLAMKQLHVHLTRLLQYFDNEPTDGSQNYLPKHVSYLELVGDDVV